MFLQLQIRRKNNFSKKEKRSSGNDTRHVLAGCLFIACVWFVTYKNPNWSTCTWKLEVVCTIQSYRIPVSPWPLKHRNTISSLILPNGSVHIWVPWLIFSYIKRTYHHLKPHCKKRQLYMVAMCWKCRLGENSLALHAEKVFHPTREQLGAFPPGEIEKAPTVWLAARDSALPERFLSSLQA